MKGYSFTELAKLVEAAMPRAGGAFSGNVSAPRFIGPLEGNADTATAAGRADRLSTARNITIGSTTKAFDGTGNLSWSLNEIGAINASATVAAANKWATPRALQIGNSSKAVDGTTNVAWSLAEIGAVNKAGDTMTGSLTFSTDVELAWVRNADYAKIGFKNTSGSDTDSYMWFKTGDNGNEYFKWQGVSGSTTTDWMSLKSSGLVVAGTITAPTFSGALAGNAATATKLATARWLSIGNIRKAFDGGGDITWSIAESAYWKHGVTADAKPAMLLVARKYVGAIKSAEGFVGRVILTRGSTTEYNYLSWADVAIRTAYNQNRVELIDVRNGGSDIQIAEVTYNSEVWYALYFPAASLRTVSTIGEFHSTPILVSDASGYATTGFISTPTTYSSVYKPTAAEVGALASNGTAVAATKLATARSIGGVAFDGTADINLPGVNTAGNQNTTGNAATATKLATARTLTIGNTGKAFDGAGNIAWSVDEIGAAHATYIKGSGKIANDIDCDSLPGIRLGEVYRNGYPEEFGNVLHLGGIGQGQLLLGWSGITGAHAGAYIRSARDAANGTEGWSPWARIYTTAWKPTAADVGAVNKAGDTMTGSLNFSDSGTTKRGIQGTAGANDQWFVGGGATASNAGYMEISTADDGSEPIYVRQYTGEFANITRTLTLLDEYGLTKVPLGVDCTNGYGSPEAGTVGNGISGGNGDNCNSTVNNLRISSWQGIGFSPSVSGQSVPYMEYSHWFNTRDGSAGMRGSLDVWGNIKCNGVLSSGSWLSSVAVLTGEIGHGGVMPIPAGFRVDQCVFFVSPRDTDNTGYTWDLREGINTEHYRIICYNSGRTAYGFTRIYNHDSNTIEERGFTMNYLVIGVK